MNSRSFFTLLVRLVMFICALLRVVRALQGNTLNLRSQPNAIARLIGKVL